MSYKINFELYPNSMILPYEIVNVDLDKINGDYLKVVLLIFRKTDVIYEIEEISNILNVSQKTVKESLEYWNERKVLLNSNKPPITNIEAQNNVNTNNIVNTKNIETQNTVNTANTANTVNRNNKPDINVVKPAQIDNDNKKQAVKLQNNVAVKEIPESSTEVKFLLDRIQELFKHTINQQYYETITRVVENYNLPKDVILLAFHYCNDILEKFNLNYFEKVCCTWSENEINTSEKADKHLLELKNNAPIVEGIKNSFNIVRVLNFKEKEFFRVWIQDFGFKSEMILSAGELALVKTGGYNFPYMNTILTNWFKEGYTDISEIKNLPSNIKAINKQNAPRLSNVSYDLDEFNKKIETVPKLV